MNVFDLRDRLVEDYSEYVRSFIQICDPRISASVEEKLQNGALWPEPLIQLNPAFEPGANVVELVQSSVLHGECRKVFATKDDRTGEVVKPLQLYRHQLNAIAAAGSGDSYVLTTGTGSGKSLTYVISIVDFVLRGGSGKGIKAIVAFSMIALEC